MLKPWYATLALAALILSCDSRQTSVQTGTRSQVLHYGNQVEPEDLDPHVITGVPEYHIVQALFEGLVVPNPADLTPLPGAAKAWENSPDKLTWTFHLRSGSLWSNGEPVTSADFVFSARRILSPNLASEYAYMLHCIKNAERFTKGDITDFSLVGVRAPDDTTLIYELERPTPYFLGLLMHHSWFPVHESTVLAHGAIDQRGSRWTRPGNLVGNGPFVLAEWEINRHIAVKRNPRYWDNATVRLNEIRFFPIENLQTEERAFRTGQLHVTSNVPPSRIEWYRTNAPTQLRIDPYLGTYYYLVNVTREPFNDPRVRKALSLSVERDNIVERILKGGQIAADCFTPHNTDGYTSAARIGFDTARARALLAEAGYGPGKKPFPPFELLYNTSETHHTVAQAVQQMWKQHLGIDVTLVNQEWKVYLSSTHSRQYDIARMGWIGDYNDPVTFLDLWLTDGGNNRTGWSNARYDSLINAAAFAPDRAGRHALFGQAEAVLLDELPIVPVYFYTNTYLLNESVKGWEPNLLNMHPFKFIRLEP